MSYVKVFAFIFFAFSFASCIEEGSYFAPASDAKIESSSLLLGKWNLTEIDYKLEKTNAVVGENASESSVTFNKDNSLVIAFKGAVINGTWETSSEMNTILVEISDNERPAYLPHVPKTWSVMKSDANNLWIDSGTHGLKFSK